LTSPTPSHKTCWIRADARFIQQVDFIDESAASPCSAGHVAQSCARIHRSREAFQDTLNLVRNVIAISSDLQGYNRNIVRDQANRITGIKIPGSTSPSITVPGVTNAFSLNQAFAYHQLDRITNFNAGVAGATTLATGMALLPNETFTYDGIGNRKTRTTQAPGVTSTQATSYTHTTGKHWLASSTGAVADTWAYDVTGNATYEANAALWGGYGSSGTTHRETIDGPLSVVLAWMLVQHSRRRDDETGGRPRRCVVQRFGEVGAERTRLRSPEPSNSVATPLKMRGLITRRNVDRIRRTTRVVGSPPAQHRIA